MSVRRPGREAELNAILISPNRQLADLFLASVPAVQGFQILGDLRSYPTQQTLEMRLRQLQPEIALIDLTTDFDEAGKLIRFLSGLKPPVHVVGLHTKNDSEAILSSVRMGACEFLFAPFEPEIQVEAVTRLRRLRQPEASVDGEAGKVITFSSAKPGSGASTLATQTAFAIKRATGKRVLLADLDLTGGSIAFFLKLNQSHSLLDLLSGSELNLNDWPSHTVSCGGVDILTAPATPYVQPVDPGRLQEVIQYAKLLYDWIVLDSQSIFHKTSMLALSESEKAFLVSTSELPSLHLTRKAIGLLNHLGFGKDRFQVVVNRLNKRDGLVGTDLGKLFDCPVHTSFPNDYFSLHRVITLGRPLANDCELGRAIENLVQKIIGPLTGDKKKFGNLMGAKPVLSET